MSHVETPWTRLASRTLRGLLIRKGATYASAAERLRNGGADESTRSVEGKATRGTYSLAFFLQVLVALDAESPAQWTKAIDRCIDSEECATHVFLLELKRHSVDPARLAKHLAKVSADITPDALTALIETGSFPFTLVLQLASLTDIVGLERFVDRSDIAAAAGECKQHHSA
ncbi:DUF6471 domain-containing protein [Ralstonia pseudosolanacearum]|uniref:DUF6471 domain-containing protein n=1 Tax=Ralstonia pseudosolanacearum TaxID=1310165 RepID=UPI000AD8CADA|nr:DUF6471 domain-containing protein [Ralstonia pseudosolanacearum]NKA09118.1 hypothetical protein [Ralstonia solanacearum]QWF60875.1 hypothetical protein KM864_17305 [Ralstonia solanacearum]TXE01735.1 hypothetical protein FUT89_00595 [Ralstonia pseudosolanacearum]BCM03955.1 hypothetical protein MAFF301560_33420 [Ralstonia solanacearum]BEU45293.1 hypothetical protein MAFF211519_06180 [Ralstonia pseudosolanacearum]